MNELVFVLPIIDILNCISETYQLRKKHRESFPIEKSWRARKLLEIVHSKLCIVDVHHIVTASILSPLLMI